MVVEDVETGYVGAVVRIEFGRMELEDRHGRRRPFPIGPGYLVDGRPVILVAPRGPAPAAAARTASGSVAVPGARARVALAGRIYVEGRHDAELVEQVWGDDLRVEGVVVEHLGGVDDLVDIVDQFRPGPGARGSACSSTTWWPARRRPASRRPSAADRVARTRWSSGTPTSTSGRPSSPAASDCGPGRSCRAAWTGSAVCARPWAGRTRRRPISPGPGGGSGTSVRDWNDLEPALIGRVEELIDFVTQARRVVAATW